MKTRKIKPLKMFIVIIFIFFLSGCKEKPPHVNVYNWGDYIDKDIIKDFEIETGIKVNYDTFATNEDLYVRLMQGNTEFDLIVPSDYMIERMIDEDMLESLDMSNIPNLEKIDEEFLNLDYDPTNEYSIPYMWGTVGIIYNKTMVDEKVDSWDILWEEKYKDQIIMLNSQRDTFAVALLKLGYSMNTRDYDELVKAKDELIKQKELVYAYQGDEVKDTMISGDAALAVVWSGDAVTMIDENEDLKYVIPKEGTNLWFDSLVIPKNAENKENAERFINFLTRPDIAARNVEYIGYSTPIFEARELLSEEQRNSETSYPDEKILENTEIFKDPKSIIRIYDELWTDLMSY